MSSLIWSYNAMAAVPTEATIRDDLYTAQAGRLLFRPEKTGVASFICPVSDASLDGISPRSLILTYRDQDSSGPTPQGGPSFVTANLRMVRQTNGHVETVANSLVGSNDPEAPNSGVNGWATHQSAKAGQTIGLKFDFATHFYYVHITMQKKAGGGGLGVMGVRLQR